MSITSLRNRLVQKAALVEFSKLYCFNRKFRVVVNASQPYLILSKPICSMPTEALPPRNSTQDHMPYRKGVTIPKTMCAQLNVAEVLTLFA